MTVRGLIEQHLGVLSARERMIARLIIEKYPFSALGGIEHIAQQSGVSPPTVTRFVRRLGFARFVDFQRAIRLEIQDVEASPLALLGRHRPPAKGLIDDHIIAALSDSVAALRTETLALAFESAAALLADERRRVLTLGGRWSSIAAQYCGFQLLNLRGNVEVLFQPPSGLLEDRIADIGKRDILVAYDFRRYQPETIAFAEAAGRRGATIILFTDPELSPIADTAQIIVPVQVATASPLDTLVPAIGATDAVLARLLDLLGPKVQKRMQALEAIRKPSRQLDAEGYRKG